MAPMASKDEIRYQETALGVVEKEKALPSTKEERAASRRRRDRLPQRHRVDEMCGVRPCTLVAIGIKSGGLRLSNQLADRAGSADRGLPPPSAFSFHQYQTIAGDSTSACRAYPEQPRRRRRRLRGQRLGT